MSRKFAFVLACALLPVIAACTPAAEEPMAAETAKPASLEPAM